MRTSQYLLSTTKETPAEAQIASHQLMLRAGMIRKLTSGIYTWMPLGLRVLQKVTEIVRSEMNKSGGLEVLMPNIQPAELWQETGRWEKYDDLLLRITDRSKRDFCFGPTHEEVITDIARGTLHSYKQLPVNLYQIQTKFRDEIRPRFGLMRARELTMKDAYSFHLEQDSLDNTYQVMFDTYCNIFNRLGLTFRPVDADSGDIGGSVSHEFQVLADTGEDAIAICEASDYAANVEKATCLPPTGDRPAATLSMEKVSTPNTITIDEVSAFLKKKANTSIKTLIVKGNETPLVALLLRGDDELNEVQADNLTEVASPLEYATDEEIIKHLGCKPGYLGPVNLDIPTITDLNAAHLADFFCGANEENFHFTGVNWGRDLPEPTTANIRMVKAGDMSPDGKGPLSIIRGIEVGHIFQLGKKYSGAMNATVLNENGKEDTMIMGCYGLGVSRVIAAAIEQHHDENGIIWPKAMAPFDIALIPINLAKSEKLQAAIEKLYQELTEAGFDVLLDDRKERPGVMFADCDLIGIPHRLVLGDRALENGIIEYKLRSSDDKQEIPLSDIVSFLQQS